MTYDCRHRRRRSGRRMGSKLHHYTQVNQLISHRLAVISIEPRKLIKSKSKMSASNSNSKRRGESLPVILSFQLTAATLALFSLVSLLTATKTQALHITTFRVPPYVPITLPTIATQVANVSHQLDLAKPILFDCDYEYQPEKDERLTIRWFKNKEPEPFYQWLPELGSRYFADWIRPLVNQSFVSDPQDPMKRYRSLLIRRLSMNLTGAYTCVVSSFDGQDSRQSTLVMYQPPRQFTFEHKIFPPPPQANMMLVGPPMQSTNVPQLLAQTQQFPLQTSRRVDPAGLLSSATSPAGQQIPQQTIAQQVIQKTSPTQFKGYAGNSALVRPPNNGIVMGNTMAPPPPLMMAAANGANLTATTKVVYTHDGRPVTKRPAGRRRKRKRRQVAAGSGDNGLDSPIASWMLAQRRASHSSQVAQGRAASPSAGYMIQLHHFTCHASQVTPRPVMMLLVKRDAESIAQYLHESSTVNVRPYQVNLLDYYGAGEQAAASSGESPPAGSGVAMITLFDVTLSATVALNVSLAPPLVSSSSSSVVPNFDVAPARSQQLPVPPNYLTSGVAMGTTANTVLPYKRGQRMSFECHLEITGTEFESRRRININETEVYQLVEQEVAKRRKLAAARRQWDQRQQQQQLANQQDQQQVTSWNLDDSDSIGAGTSENGDDLGSDSSGASATWTYNMRSGCATQTTLATLLAGSTVMMLLALRARTCC